MSSRLLRGVIVGIALLAWRGAAHAERPVLHGPSVASVDPIHTLALVAQGGHHGTWDRTGRDSGKHPSATPGSALLAVAIATPRAALPRDAASALLGASHRDDALRFPFDATAPPVTLE